MNRLTSHDTGRIGRATWLMAAALLGCLVAAPVRAVNLQGPVEQLIRGRDVGEARVAVLIRDLTDNRVIADIHSERPMIPASNLKLLTSAAAMDILGLDFVFRTRLLRRGDDLIVRGDGDPAFGDPVLLDKIGMDVDAMVDAWVGAVKMAGMRKVEAIIVDDRVFDRTFVHPNWPKDQLDRWYCAQVGGLNFNNNCLDLYAAPTRPGEAPRIMTRPSDTPVQLSNVARTTDRNAFWATRLPDTNRITLRGEIKHALMQPIYITIDDPPMFFAGSLQRRLTGSQVPAMTTVRIGDEQIIEADQILAVAETPLATVVARCNRDSQNLFAESLFKRIGMHRTGQPGSWLNGRAAVLDFLARRVGPAAGDAVLDDGSGMSRENRVTARLLIQLLAAMHADPKLGEPFRLSLAGPGERGTLQQRLTGDVLKGELRAKSGYLRHTISLSGYLTYPDRTIAFSVLLNDYKKQVAEGRKLIDDILKLVDAEYGKDVSEKLGG